MTSLNNKTNKLPSNESELANSLDNDSNLGSDKLLIEDDLISETENSFLGNPINNNNPSYVGRIKVLIQGCSDSHLITIGPDCKLKC